jgi:hypothetical protein
MSSASQPTSHNPKRSCIRNDVCTRSCPATGADAYKPTPSYQLLLFDESSASQSPEYYNLQCMFSALLWREVFKYLTRCLSLPRPTTTHFQRTCQVAACSALPRPLRCNGKHTRFNAMSRSAVPTANARSIVLRSGTARWL